MKYYIIRG